MKMDPEDKKRLRVNFADIVRTVKTEEVIDSLFADGILTEDDMDQLDIHIVGMSQRKSTRLLIRILPKRGPKAFECFIKALKCDDIHTWLAVQIEQTDVSSISDVDEVDSFTEEEKIEEMKKQLLTQTKMLTQYFTDKKQLEEKLNKLKPNDAVINQTQYTLLSETMKKYDLQEETVVAFLKQYLEGKSMKMIEGDVDIKLVPQGGKAEATSDSEDVCDYMELTEEEMIARDIGRYIVKHMMFRDTSNSTYCVAPDTYSERMQNMVDELIHHYEDAFQDYLRKLNFDEINGFETLANIGNAMFSEGQQNWGRIVTFYAFGSYLAKHFSVSDERIADNVGNFLGFFIARKLGTWIKENGGWEGFLGSFPDKSLKEASGGWKNALFTVLGLGALVGIVAKSGPNP